LKDVTATLFLLPPATFYYKDFATTLQDITEYPSEIMECRISKMLIIKNKLN